MVFDLIVEGPLIDVDGEPLNRTPNALELVRLEWPHTLPPDVITLEGGTMLVKVARYVSRLSGRFRYQYRVASSASLVAGQLQENVNAL